MPTLGLHCVNKTYICIYANPSIGFVKALWQYFFTVYPVFNNVLWGYDTELCYLSVELHIPSQNIAFLCCQGKSSKTVWEGYWNSHYTPGLQQCCLVTNNDLKDLSFKLDSPAPSIVYFQIAVTLHMLLQIHMFSFEDSSVSKSIETML